MQPRSTPPHHSPATDNNGDVSRPSNPKWETAILAVSFVALWGWWLARQNAYQSGGEFSPFWNIGLGVVVALLIWVFVRRLKRALNAMRELKGR